LKNFSPFAAELNIEILHVLLGKEFHDGVLLVLHYVLALRGTKTTMMVIKSIALPSGLSPGLTHPCLIFGQVRKFKVLKKFPVKKGLYLGVKMRAWYRVHIL
jgi:hypothetical protein